MRLSYWLVVGRVMFLCGENNYMCYQCTIQGHCNTFSSRMKIISMNTRLIHIYTYNKFRHVAISISNGYEKLASVLVTGIIKEIRNNRIRTHYVIECDWMWLDSRVMLNPLCNLFMFMFVCHGWPLSNAAHFNTYIYINAPSILTLLLIFDRDRRPDNRNTKYHGRLIS